MISNSYDVLEYSIAPSSVPSDSPTLNPTSNPTISSPPSGTPTSSPTSLAPTPIPEPYPMLPPPLNAPQTYFNYDRSSAAQYGPGSTTKNWVNIGSTYRGYQYDHNKWSDTKFVGNEDYWHEFSTDGFG
jgi:hypothetical protein